MDFDIARRNMVDSQIRPNNVTEERLIGAMEALPREAFVPSKYQGVAYIDDAVPLGNGRHMMAPMVMARLIEAASPAPQDLALVIGCATGYEAAVLSHLVGTVVAVESDAGMAQQAAQTLTGLEIDTVAVVGGDLDKGANLPDESLTVLGRELPGERALNVDHHQHRVAGLDQPGTARSDSGVSPDNRPAPRGADGVRQRPLAGAADC